VGGESWGRFEAKDGSEMTQTEETPSDYRRYFELVLPHLMIQKVRER
jgi:hypothetical protein